MNLCGDSCLSPSSHSPFCFHYKTLVLSLACSCSAREAHFRDDPEAAVTVEKKTLQQSSWVRRHGPAKGSKWNTCRCAVHTPGAHTCDGQHRSCCGDGAWVLLCRSRNRLEGLLVWQGFEANLSKNLVRTKSSSSRNTAWPPMPMCTQNGNT